MLRLLGDKSPRPLTWALLLILLRLHCRPPPSLFKTRCNPTAAAAAAAATFNFYLHGAYRTLIFRDFSGPSYEHFPGLSETNYVHFPCISRTV